MITPCVTVPLTEFDLIEIENARAAVAPWVRVMVDYLKDEWPPVKLNKYEQILAVLDAIPALIEQVRNERKLLP